MGDLQGRLIEVKKNTEVAGHEVEVTLTGGSVDAILICMRFERLL